MVCKIGDQVETEQAESVFVATDPSDFEVLRASVIPAVLVPTPDAAATLVERWGMRHAADSVETEVIYVSGEEPLPLTDTFVTLRAFLDEEASILTHLPCEELRLERSTEKGRLARDRTMVIRDDCVYWDASLGPARMLAALAKELHLEIGPEEIDGIIRNKLSNEVRALRKSIATEKDVNQKLVMAVGEEALKAALPPPLIESLPKKAGGYEYASSALAVHGADTLSVLKQDLEERGLDPPSSWAGTKPALKFVNELGFPRQYAGFPGSKRPNELQVEGPPKLGKLHDYQAIIVDEIHDLLRIKGKKGRRGLISLPTGAGKTRVTVEALVRAFEADLLDGPVLWVAETDELNEQAVQAWSEVWRAFGPVGQRLTVSRLWDQNDVDHVESGHQVVVATISKLNSGVIDSKQYKWLTKTACLVIDEAHMATTPQYTGLLEWQGLTRSGDRVPLLGLTATPFRGVSEEETKRLVTRFGKKRLDVPAFNGEEPYASLQKRGVLAKVEHDLLEGMEIDLDKDELRELKKMRRLPGAAAKRIGADVERNATIVKSIKSKPKDWTVLLFAASVDHARIIAALLAQEDISAAAISGSTPPATRRHYVERFREGELRVLTNYGVFTQGFDAPAVRAVYVTRPTYSPNLYQQMIGRGLRGPENRGKETCQIVNVKDNVANFGDQLAFYDFEHLWTDDDA